MATWDDGLEAIEAAKAGPAEPYTGWRIGIPRIPIVVMGSPGAGKTEVWRHLSGKDAPDAMSTRVDQGYFRGVGSKAKRALTITTIPGQTSQERRSDLRERFGADTLLHGVVFVAAFGFDQIWPREADGVANDLEPFEMRELLNRNLRRELKSFEETCDRIREKYQAGGPTMTPSWLLVLVNKADLYWPGRDAAKAHYLPGSGSAFDRVAQRLMHDLGKIAAPHYEVMPVTLRTGPYEFRSNRDNLDARTHLTEAHAAASRRYMMQRLEDLGGIRA